MARQPAGFWLGLALGAVLAGGAGALLMRTTAPTVASRSASPGPPGPSTVSPPPAARRASTSSSGLEASTPAPAPARDRVDDTPTTEALLREALGDQGEAPVDVPREPRARGQWLEDNVMLLLTSVAPELDGSEVTRQCTPDGSVCTIEGPWPGDDFLGRWLDAISDGVIAPGDLSGVTFSRFENTDGDDGSGFRITAHAPPH